VEKLDDVEGALPLDGGDKTATVKLTKADQKVAAAFAERTMSDPKSNPVTGADLGAGPGAGTTTERT
jgi:Mn-containing catalase